MFQHAKSNWTHFIAAKWQGGLRSRRKVDRNHTSEGFHLSNNMLFQRYFVKITIFVVAHTPKRAKKGFQTKQIKNFITLVGLSYDVKLKEYCKQFCAKNAISPENDIPKLKKNS